LRLILVRLQNLLLIPLSLSDGSWKTMAMKWSKFWLDKTESEKHDHATKCHDENELRRRPQEDFELAASLLDNEAATTNFISVVGGPQMAARVRALCLPLLVCRFTLSAVARLYGLFQTPRT
jgi:hypothetical protein